MSSCGARFLTLVAIENAERNIDAKADKGLDVRALAAQVQTESRIGGAVGYSEPVVRPGLVHALYCRPQVWPVVERHLPEFLQRGRKIGEIEWPGDVQFLHRRLIVEQCAELDLSRAQVNEGGLHIGFELHALQFQAVEIDLSDVAGLEAIAADGERAIVELKALARDASTAFCWSTCTKAVRRSKSRFRS